MEKLTKIFLVDDHKLLRDTLKMFLESEKNMKVVGEAGNGADALEGVFSLYPDLVLMDITLPDFDGVETTEKIVKALPKTKVIAMTMHPENLYLMKFLQAGGRGYIHKSAADRDLLKAIDMVQRGNVFLSPDGVQVMAGQYLAANLEENENNEDITSSNAFKEVPSPNVLSERERQVLQLYVRGYSCREIGEFLFLATSTVDSYKRRISEKLNLSKRADLLEYTMRHEIFNKRH
jgi:DNA-binding NarL/FixJ family response regulator